MAKKGGGGGGQGPGGVARDKMQVRGWKGIGVGEKLTLRASQIAVEEKERMGKKGCAFLPQGPMGPMRAW